MWAELKQWAKTAGKKDLKEDILKDMDSVKMYFANALQSSNANAHMEEYLYRGLQKLMDVEDGIKEL